jgi:Uma2 family endonuclease
MPRYARAGIPEVWLANLPEDRIEVHSEPVNGVYQKVQIGKRGQSLSSESIPNLVLSVDEILC